MSGTLRPYFWIRRNAETYVPLVPVDELPNSIGLRGISTTKSWEDVCQGEMRFLGDHYDHSGQHYMVDLFSPTADAAMSPPKVFRAPDKKDVQQAARTDGAIGVRDADQVQADIDHITSTQEQSPEGSQGDSQDDSKYLANAGTLGKKVYCTYWIRTGNCNYMQEGCKYKHEIPPDDETRLAIGVRTYPTWPREDPTPPPRPAKASLHQNWRRQDGRGPQTELLGTQKGANQSKVTSRPAVTSSPPQSGVPQPHRKGHKPAQHRAMPKTSQPTVNTNNASQQQSQGQACASGLLDSNDPHKAAAPTATESLNHQSAHMASRAPLDQPATIGANAQQSLPPNQPLLGQTGSAVQLSNGNTQTILQPSSNGNLSDQRATPNPYAQTDSKNSSNRLSGYHFGQNARPQNDVHTNGFAFGAKGFAKTSSPPVNTVRSAGPPPHIPTHTQIGQSMTTQTQYPAMLSYDNHPFATSSSTDGKDPASSSSQVNTPTTSTSHAAIISANNAAFSHNSQAATGFDFRSGTPANVNGNSYGKLSGNTPSFLGGNGSALPQTPVSANSSVVSRFNAKYQDPFSPPPFSPPPFHRRLFVEPGQAEYVANPIDVVHNKPQRPIKKNANGSVHGKGQLHRGKASHVGNDFGHGRVQALV